jgi:hypothetical protein
VRTAAARAKFGAPARHEVTKNTTLTKIFSHKTFVSVVLSVSS